MLQQDSELLARIRGVTALTKAEAYATPTAAVANRASEQRFNPYTSPEVLSRIYAPLQPPRITHAVTSPNARAARVRHVYRPPAYCRVAADTDMQCRPPHHVMPLRSFYQAHAGYYIDALRFARALEESQRTAIKFEECRCWSDLQKQHSPHVHKLMPTTAQPPLAWDVDPLGSLSTTHPSDKATATRQAVPPLPKRNFGKGGRKLLSGEHGRAINKEKVNLFVKTLLEPYKAPLSASRNNSHPQSTMGSHATAETMTAPLGGTEDEGVRRRSTTPSVVDTPNCNEGVSIPFNTVRADRMCEVECCAKAPSQYATGLNTRDSVSPPPLIPSEATRCSDVSEDTKKVELPCHTAPGKQSQRKCPPVMKGMQKSKDVSLVDTAELRALRREHAAALVSSTLSSVFATSSSLASSRESPANPPIDTTVPAKHRGAANASAAVSPAGIPATAALSLLRQRLNASRPIMSSVLACTAALHRAPMSRSQMNVTHDKNKEALSVALPEPSLRLRKSLDHHDSAFAPPLPVPAHENDMYQLNRQLAYQLVGMMTNSTETTDRAPPSGKLDKVSNS